MNIIVTSVFYCLFVTSCFALSPRRVIVDVDTGTDDYEALVLLINADNNKEIKIEAITCTEGNTKLYHVRDNVLRLLETSGRIDIPIYLGVNNTFIKSDNFFGIDGFGDYSFTKYPNIELTKDVPSVMVMQHFVTKHPKEISIIVLGPMTNVALAMMMYDDFADAIKDIHVMGGNHNSERVEFNFQSDPRAARAVFELAKSPINVLTWEGCISKYIPNSWFFGINIDNPVWNLLKKCAEAKFENEQPDTKFIRCDVILAAAFLNPSLITNSVQAHATVLTSGSNDVTGLVVADTQSQNPNINIIDTFDLVGYQNFFIDGFENICKNACCKDVY